MKSVVLQSSSLRSSRVNSLTMYWASERRTAYPIEQQRNHFLTSALVLIGLTPVLLFLVEEREFPYRILRTTVSRKVRV